MGSSCGWRPFPRPRPRPHSPREIGSLPFCVEKPREPQILKTLTGFASPMEQDVTLCKVEEIPDGALKHFEIMGYDVMVVRLGDHFYCVDEACTYKWAMLTDGHVEGGEQVEAGEVSQPHEIEAGLASRRSHRGERPRLLQRAARVPAARANLSDAGAVRGPAASATPLSWVDLETPSNRTDESHGSTA